MRADKLDVPVRIVAETSSLASCSMAAMVRQPLWDTPLTPGLPLYFRGQQTVLKGFTYVEVDQLEDVRRPSDPAAGGGAVVAHDVGRLHLLGR